VDGPHSELSSLASSNKVTEESAVSFEYIFERLRLHDKFVQVQAEHNRKMEADFSKLEGLLREYYLEMDLASVEDSSPADEQRWYKRIWRRKLGGGEDKDNKETSILMIKDETDALPRS